MFLATERGREATAPVPNKNSNFIKFYFKSLLFLARGIEGGLPFHEKSQPDKFVIKVDPRFNFAKHQKIYGKHIPQGVPPKRLQRD